MDATLQYVIDFREGDLLRRYRTSSVNVVVLGSRKDNESLIGGCINAMKIMKVNDLKSLRNETFVTAKHKSASDEYALDLVNSNLCTCSLEKYSLSWDFAE